jgi:protein gp37
MAKTTQIEWCDSSVNPEIGCDGCELWRVNPKEPNRSVLLCYAGKLTEQYAGLPGWPVNFTTPKIFPGRVEEAAKWGDLTNKDRPEKPWLTGMPRVIFVGDMGDLFTESLPLDWLAPLIPVMANSPHLWLMLTKRATRMRDFWKAYGDVPHNIWLGTSVTSSNNMMRLKYLSEIDAHVKFASFEPVLGPMAKLWTVLGDVGDPQWLDWAIVGGLSGAQGYSHPGWIADVLTQLDDRQIMTFFKQWGSIKSNPDRKDPTARENGGNVKGGRLLFGKEKSEMPAVAYWRKNETGNN